MLTARAIYPEPPNTFEANFIITDFVTPEEYSFLMIKHGDNIQLSVKFTKSLSISHTTMFQQMTTAAQEDLVLEFFIGELS